MVNKSWFLLFTLHGDETRFQKRSTFTLTGQGVFHFGGLERLMRNCGTLRNG
jgi:hypothetical protein